MENPAVKISLPVDEQYIPVVTDAVKSLCKIIGFSKEEIAALQLATEEAVLNVIKYAYQQEEGDRYEVILQEEESCMRIILKEKGAPFNPSLIQEYDPELLKNDKHYKRLGTYLMKQLVDDITFHNLGKEGREIHLIKYYDRHIHHLIDGQKLRQDHKEKAKALSPDEPVNYSVRRMKPEEALEVSKVAYSAYGYTYINEDVYFPERLRILNGNDDLISFIAVKDDGEIIAHNAFERRADKNIPELGVAFTNPVYRGRGCLNRLTTALLDEAEKHEYTGIFALGITTHPFSQKTLIKYGFRDCALYLSKGKERTYKGIEQKKLQRESTVVLFKYVIPPEKLTIYPPEHHREMISGLYSYIGFSPDNSGNNGMGDPEHDLSVVSVRTNVSSQTADIYIIEYGRDIISEIHRKLRGLCINRTETIFLRMRLSDPFTALFTKEFERMGFFFCGILPRSHGNDEFILQYLNNYEIDYDQLAIASPKGNEIMNYIRDRNRMACDSCF